MPVKIARVDICFKSPGPHPNGLQATEEGLWCIDQGNNRLYRQEYVGGAVLFEAQTDTVKSSGMTLGGGFIISKPLPLVVVQSAGSTGQVG